MSDLYGPMLTAVMETLYDGERREINANLMRRIVRICADAAAGFLPGASPEPPPLNWIKAYTLRAHDLIWLPADARFVALNKVDDDPRGLVWVEFEDGSDTSFERLAPIQVPMNRSGAMEWNLRRAAFEPGVVSEVIEAQRATHI